MLILAEQVQNIFVAVLPGSGGHKGVESIIRALKTKNFTRLRIGVSPKTASGKIKKIAPEDKLLDFLMSDFKPQEKQALKNVSKKIFEALDLIIAGETEKAMNRFNA